ncbi:MAG: hypothetical protein WCO56_24340 [Verrucomicrobiota bacterium]
MKVSFLENSKTTTTYCLAALCLVAAFGCTPTDPIDQVVKMESKNPGFRRGMYFRGFRTTNQLSLEVVAAKAVGASLTNIVLLEKRQVFIPMKGFEHVPGINDYTAVLLKNGSKRIVLLLQNNPGSQSWSYRSYKAE